MPKKAKRKSSKSGVRVRDLRARKDAKGGGTLKISAANKLL
jgi:hypothetical protein